MNRDPPPPYEDPQTGTALAHGLGALEVVFTAPSSVDPVTQKPIPSAEWLRSKFSIWEPELRFGLGTGNNVLSTFADFPNDTIITELTRFTGCPKVPHGNYEPATSCERDLEGALATLLHNLMRPRLMEMVSKIPSPNVWDAGGLVGQAPELRQLARYQLDQTVTFFADIPDW